MAATTRTTTTTSTPTTTHLSSLAAGLHSASDRESLARVFAELADESIALCDTAPTREAWQFWMDMHERFYGKSRRLSEPAPPKPRRRWFR